VFCERFLNYKLITMKYLEDDRLSNLTARLQECTVGSRRKISGRIEAYTMKRAGNDKKYAAELGLQYVEWQEHAENCLKRKRSFSVGAVDDRPNRSRSRTNSWDETRSANALGDLGDMSTRRLLTDFILTLNMAYPDYDFASTKPHDFLLVRLPKVMNQVQVQLSILPDATPLITELWSAMDEVIHLGECIVYQWTADDDIQKDELWSFHYLVVNKTLKRIVYFSCKESMVQPSPSPYEEERTVFVKETEMGDIDLDSYAYAAGGLPISTV
jgi:hypothetical protein